MKSVALQNKSRLIFSIIACMFYCCSKQNTDCKILIVENNLAPSIKIQKAICFSQRSDFVYPVHKYLVVTGSNTELQSLIKNIGLFRFSDSLVKITNSELNEYQNGWLWDSKGRYDTKEDSVFRNNFNMPQQVDFAAYFNSCDSDKVFINPKNNWNGKIVASLKNDSCIIFVEELKHPSHKRVTE